MSSVRRVRRSSMRHVSRPFEVTVARQRPGLLRAPRATVGRTVGRTESSVRRPLSTTQNRPRRIGRVRRQAIGRSSVW